MLIVYLMMKGDEVQLTGTVVVPVSPDPGLIRMIKNYTNALKYLVNEILEDPAEYGEFRYSRRSKAIKWYHDLRKIHYTFYNKLKERFKLPGARAQDCIREAISIAKSVLNNPNNDSWKVEIKTYRMRVRNIDWKLYKVKGKIEELFVGGYGYVKVKGFPSEHYRHFEYWNPGELILIYKNGEIKAYLSFKIDRFICNPSINAIAVDVNMNEIVIGNYKEELRIRTPMWKIMHIKKNHIDKTQKRYNKIWLAINDIKRAISKWWKRIHNINENFAKQCSAFIVNYAVMNGYDTIILEDLEKLKDKHAKLTKPWRERFNFFAYRRLQFWIEWQAKKSGLAVVYVDPRNTSAVCPVCSSKLVSNGYRKLKCEECNLEFDRDRVAILNLVNKYLRMWGRRSVLNGETFGDDPKPRSSKIKSQEVSY